MNDSRLVTVSVQVIPNAPDVYAVVDRAIEAIQATGIKHIVTPMETVMEGTLDDCLAAAKAAHLACFVGGAKQAITFIKIADAVDGSTIDDKLAQYR